MGEHANFGGGFHPDEDESRVNIHKQIPPHTWKDLPPEVVEQLLRKASSLSPGELAASQCPHCQDQIPPTQYYEDTSHLWPDLPDRDRFPRGSNESKLVDEHGVGHLPPGHENFELPEGESLHWMKQCTNCGKSRDSHERVDFRPDCPSCKAVAAFDKIVPDWHEQLRENNKLRQDYRWYDGVPKHKSCRSCDFEGTREDLEDHAEKTDHYKMPVTVAHCPCGSTVHCDGFTSTCGECGRDYGGNGDILAPRSQWGAETGESWRDVLEVDEHEPGYFLDHPDEPTVPLILHNETGKENLPYPQSLKDFRHHFNQFHGHEPYVGADSEDEWKNALEMEHTGEHDKGNTEHVHQPEEWGTSHLGADSWKDLVHDGIHPDLPHSCNEPNCSQCAKLVADGSGDSVAPGNSMAWMPNRNAIGSVRQSHEEYWQHEHCGQCGSHDHETADHPKHELGFCEKCGQDDHTTAEHGDCDYCGRPHDTKEHEDEPEEEDGYIASDRGKWFAQLEGHSIDDKGIQIPFRSRSYEHPTEAHAINAMHHAVEKSGFSPNIWNEGYNYPTLIKKFYPEHEEWKKDPDKWLNENLDDEEWMAHHMSDENAHNDEYSYGDPEEAHAEGHSSEVIRQILDGESQQQLHIHPNPNNLREVRPLGLNGENRGPMKEGAAIPDLGYASLFQHMVGEHPKDSHLNYYINSEDRSLRLDPSQAEKLRSGDGQWLMDVHEANHKELIRALKERAPWIENPYNRKQIEPINLNSYFHTHEGYANLDQISKIHRLGPRKMEATQIPPRSNDGDGDSENHVSDTAGESEGGRGGSDSGSDGGGSSSTASVVPYCMTCGSNSHTTDQCPRNQRGPGMVPYPCKLCGSDKHGTDDHYVKRGNILDPIQRDAQERLTLDPLVFTHPTAVEPHMKNSTRHWIRRQVYDALHHAGYNNPERYIHLVLTGSLTSYQYQPGHSDADISIWPQITHMPEWDRAKLIKICQDALDGKNLPGTEYPMQTYVMDPATTSPDIVYVPGLRSAYDLDADKWIVPPDPGRVHDFAREYPDYFHHAQQVAEKMRQLIQFHPERVKAYWKRVHTKRRDSQLRGEGDFAQSNADLKMIENNGLIPDIERITGWYIA